MYTLSSVSPNVSVNALSGGNDGEPQPPRRRSPQLNAAELTLSELILPSLREAIIKRDLPPGTRLGEVQLSKRYGVSRTPVRQALQALEQEGLIVILPRAGAFVTRITKKDVDEIYELRAELEGFATRLAAERLDRVGRAWMEEIQEQMRTALADSGVSSYADTIDQFHLTVLRLAGNSRIEKIYRDLMPSIRRLRRLALTRRERPEQSLRQHLEIANRVLAGDLAAGDLMHDHLEDGRRQLRELADDDEPRWMTAAEPAPRDDKG